MKKTLSVLGILSVLAFSAQSSQAFEWKYLNPANWGTCSKCECPKGKCKCKKECNPCKKKDCGCMPKCDDGYPCPAAPPAPCDACDQLQTQMQHRNSIK